MPRSIPASYRWATNVVVYALTHGNIADYRDYVPEDLLSKQDVPLTAQRSVKISSAPWIKE